MKAIILAGGKGARLTPYTTIFPKPMLPIGEKPVLEIIIRQLAYYGFKEIVLSIGYLSEIIQSYFQDKRNLPAGIEISYIKEDKPLGTAGPISALADINETFLVMNGDVLTTMDFSKLIAEHKKNKAILTIGVVRKTVNIDLGVVEIDGNSRVTNYIEKPVYNFYDSMGIYIYEPQVIKYIKPGVRLDFPTLVHQLIRNGEKVFSYFCDKEYYWIDMGTHGDYNKANEDFAARRKEFLPDENTSGV